MDKLGVIKSGKVRFFLQPAYPNFVRHSYRAAPPDCVSHPHVLRR